MAAISIAILLDFRRAFARIHPFDPGASYGFPMEMDMKNATLARSTGIATALFATALAAGPAATAQEKYTPTAANLEARAWFQGCQVRDVHSLGRVQRPGRWGMDHGDAADQ